MSTPARVTSIEAMIALRARLVAYHERARAGVDEVRSEVLRTRVWLQQDRRMHWEGRARRCRQEFDEAKQALYNVELSNLRATSAAEQMAVRRAKTALDEALEKLERVKKWNREFDSRIEPVARRLDRLDTFLSKSLPEAIARLDRMIQSLEAYRDMSVPAGAAGERPAQPDPSDSSAPCDPPLSSPRP